jgi:hypothetical protein
MVGRWTEGRNSLRPGSQLHGEREWTCRLGYALEEEAPKHEFGSREVETRDNRKGPAHFGSRPLQMGKRHSVRRSRVPPVPIPAGSSNTVGYVPKPRKGQPYRMKGSEEQMVDRLDERIRRAMGKE